MKCPYVMKKCRKCGEVLHISRYHKDKNCKYKVRNICKECQKKIGKSYYNKNKKEILDKCKVYREEHKEEKRKQNKVYRENHKEEGIAEGFLSTCQSSYEDTCCRRKA